jgi:heme exporter protein C
MFWHKLASPKYFYEFSGKLLPWLGGLASIFWILGLMGGLYLAPPDYQQGNAFRIIYIHVPCAVLSLSLYTLMASFAFAFLVWKIKLADVMTKVIAPIGASFTALALVTGAIWGKPMWGTWWIWDARLTSELILLFIYLGIVALRNAAPNPDTGAKISAILILVGLIDIPIIHYSVYWWNTLHQGSTLSVFAKPKIDGSMLYPLLLTMAGFFLYCLWIILEKARHELLLREKRQAWVKIQFEGEFK